MIACGDDIRPSSKIFDFGSGQLSMKQESSSVRAGRKSKSSDTCGAKTGGGAIAESRNDTV